MAYVHSIPSLGLPPITDRSTTAKQALGAVTRAVDPTYGAGEFVYLKGVASCVLGSWVTYKDDGGITTLATANAVGPLAVAMAATTASYYGWFQVRGVAIGKCLTGLASNVRVYLTGTGGSVDDASVAGDGINIARSASATTVNSFVAEFDINYPWVNDHTNFTL